jgi:hypothetical protein
MFGTVPANPTVDVDRKSRTNVTLPITQSILQRWRHPRAHSPQPVQLSQRGVEEFHSFSLEPTDLLSRQIAILTDSYQ